MIMSFWPFSFLSRFRTSSQSQTINSDMAENVNLDETNGDEKNSQNEVDTVLKRLSDLQEELLTSLKEDISDWIIKTLGEADISVDNFLQALDTGIILCKLSMIIEKKAQECLERGLLKEPLPAYKLHCDENALSGTWYARDNTANFLSWCRAYGMADNTLFDSEDLVIHRHERQVIYCLMELARIGARYGLEPPSLITMEKEIDSEIAPSHSPVDGTPVDNAKEDKPNSAHSDVPCPLDLTGRLLLSSRKSQQSILDTEMPKLLHSLFFYEFYANNQNGARFEFKEDGNFQKLLYFLRMKDDDHVYKVILKWCECEDHVSKLSEGVFNVCGKRVFIRLLKGKHLMIRVGGGWDTFENYLLHHIPIEVFRFSHGSHNELVQSSSSSSPGNPTKFGHKKYLVIRSKYRSESFNS